MIESLTLHLGFPVSVDPSHSPRRGGLKSSSSSWSNSSRSSSKSKSRRRRHQQESKKQTSPTAPSSSSCHAFEWMEDVSGYFSRMVSCGGAPFASSHEDDHSDLLDDDAASSILLVSPTPKTSNPAVAYSSLSFPALEPAHSIHSNSSSRSQAAVPRAAAAIVSPPPTKAAPAQPLVFSMTDKTPTVRNSKSKRSNSSRNKYSSSSETDDDDETQLTTATTASVHSVLSWNTLPTRDTSLESQCSSSLLDGLEFVAPPPPPATSRRINKNRRCRNTNTTTIHGNSTLSPLPLAMRRCTSDPAQADQLNARHVKASVFPHLSKARPITTTRRVGQ